MFSPLKRLWRKSLYLYRNITYVRMLVIGIFLGVLTGIASILFFLGIEYFKHLIQAQWAGLSLPAPAGEAMFHGHSAESYRPWIIPLSCAVVGLVTGWLVERFLPHSINGMTDGTDAMIKAFHQDRGVIKPCAPLIKGLTSIFTIASGGSAGREGPISQIGAGLGSWMADFLGLSIKERRILMLTGAAGGLGAVFRAPLGGALTAIEVIYKEDFESEAILPAVISSVVAYSIFTFAFGTEPMFGIPEFSFSNIFELPFYVILAFACALTGWMYVRTFQYLKYSVFEKMRAKVGIMWTMAAGGLIMGMFGMMYPKVISGGYGWLEQAILGELTITTMIVVVLAKTLATSITLGSGMSGGMFAPALFVGGMTGGVVGFSAHKFYPDVVAQPGGYVLVGMAAFFAGVANAPIGPLVMVCELTQGYGLLAPLMLASAICLVVSRKTSLYENQLENKFESPAHINDATINILEKLHVSDFFQRGRVTILEESITLKALTDIIAGTNEFFFPVKNHDGEITGILSLNDVRNLLYEECLFDLVIVGELARPPITLEENDDLYTALLKFVDSDLGQIPVIKDNDPHTILGLINRADVFRAYTTHLRVIQAEE